MKRSKSEYEKYRMIEYGGQLGSLLFIGVVILFIPDIIKNGFNLDFLSSVTMLALIPFFVCLPYVNSICVTEATVSWKTWYLIRYRNVEFRLDQFMSAVINNNKVQNELIIKYREGEIVRSMKILSFNPNKLLKIKNIFESKA